MIELKESNTHSVLVAYSVEPRLNHTPVEVSITKDGIPLTVWLLRGTYFITKDGDAVEPLVLLSTTEFLHLSKMLGGVDEAGNTIERTLPLDWESISEMVLELRAENNKQIEVTDD